MLRRMLRMVIMQRVVARRRLLQPRRVVAHWRGMLVMVVR